MTVDRSTDRSVEQAFEDLLAGRPADGAGDLAAFTAAVRASTARAPRPNAALTALLSTGLLTDQPSPSTRTADQAAAIARPPRRRPTTVITDLLAACAAKTASVGLAAKAAAAVGIALASVTTAGAVDALPASAQHVFDEVTPFTAAATDDGTETEQPTTATPQDPADVDDAGADAGDDPATDSATGSADDSGDESADTLTADDDGTKDQGSGDADVPTSGGIGGYVSSGRHNGTVTGSAADIAHERNESRKAGSSSDDVADADEVEDDADEVEDTDDSTEDDGDEASGSSSNRGPSANSGSSGKGSSGKGSSGKGGHGSDD